MFESWIYVTLDKSLPVSELQFPHYIMRIMIEL